MKFKPEGLALLQKSRYADMSKSWREDIYIFRIFLNTTGHISTIFQFPRDWQSRMQKYFKPRAGIFNERFICQKR